MKILLSILLLLSSSTYASDWSDEDISREAVLLVIHTIDWGQTRYIAENPDQFHEINPLLDTNPSVWQVNNYFILSGLAHIAISNALPPEWRKGWQYVTIGIGVANVSRNHSIGLRISF